MTISLAPCPVCGANAWDELPPPHATRAMRSDGAVAGHPMLKAHCSGCALVRSISIADSEALTTLYTDEYDLYNSRPAAEQFVTGRYTALAEAITSSVAPLRPRRVLEVGCGNGSALQAIQAAWPDAFCIGMEPVVTAVQAAQAAGFNVLQGIIGGAMPAEIAEAKFDVIYSIHVIEHTEDPAAFLNGLKPLLAPGGRVVITCPDARQPNLEIARSDHQYSMTPYHLAAVAQKAGFVGLKSTQCPGGGEGIDYEHNQLLVCCLPEAADGAPMAVPWPAYLEAPERLRLLEARRRYFSNFAALDPTLTERLAPYARVVCFGAGGWASVLAGYAPEAWGRVQACVVDGGADEDFSGKPILDPAALREIRPDAVLVGVNPAIQPMIAERLEQAGYRAIRWDDFIPM